MDFGSATYSLDDRVEAVASHGKAPCLTHVRISEIHFKLGDSIPMHSHPDYFVYVLSGGTLKLSYPDGHTKGFTEEPEHAHCPQPCSLGFYFCAILQQLGALQLPEGELTPQPAPFLSQVWYTSGITFKANHP